MKTATLPEHWRKFLLTQPKTGMDYQIVALTLRDGRIVEDVATAAASIISEVRGYTEIPFDPADIAHTQVTHRKWDFQHESEGRNPAAI
jgi:hypothetical protein